MHYKRSSDSFPFSGNRFETTYSSSYNRIITYPKKPNLIKIPDTKELEIKTKYEPIIISPSQPITKLINKPPPPIEIKPIDVSYSHMVTQIARITDSLYLSSMHAISADRLKSLGITLVVSLVTDVTLARLPAGVQRLHVPIDDTEHANIARHFESVLERIRAEIDDRGGRVLVHCVAGVSRSSTIVLAFLMRHKNLSLRSSYELALAARPYIQPNVGFWRQLIEYERAIFGSASVALVPAADNSRALVPDVPPSALAQIVSAAASTPPGFPAHSLQRSPLAIYPLSRAPFHSL